MSYKHSNFHSTSIRIAFNSIANDQIQKNFKTLAIQHVFFDRSFETNRKHREKLRKRTKSTGHDNTISHDDTCALKEDFNSYQVKCITELQNVKDVFLKKLSDVEQKLERNFREKEYDGKYGRLLNLLEKENLFLKHEIRRKDKVINILLEIVYHNIQII